MPVPARRLESGTIWVDVAAEPATGRVVLYARVSSHDQRSDLDRQVGRLAAWATSNGYAVAEVVSHPRTESGYSSSRRSPCCWCVLADARHLPHGRSRAGTATSTSTRPGTTSRRVASGLL